MGIISIVHRAYKHKPTSNFGEARHCRSHSPGTSLVFSAGCASSSCSPTSWPTAPASAPVRRPAAGCVPWAFWRRCGGPLWRRSRVFLWSWEVETWWNLMPMFNNFKHTIFDLEWFWCSHQTYASAWFFEMNCLEKKKWLGSRKKCGLDKMFCPTFVVISDTKAHAEPFLCLFRKRFFGNFQSWQLRSNHVYW